MYDTLFINHKYYTKQSEWVLLLTRIYAINDLDQIAGHRSASRNLIPFIWESGVIQDLVDHTSSAGYWSYVPTGINKDALALKYLLSFSKETFNRANSMAIKIPAIIKSIYRIP